MRMSTEMVKVDGRVLSPPAVELGGDRTEQPRNGSWDMRNKKFKAGEAVGAYAVACFSNPRYCGHDQLRNFFRQMSQQCGREGMRMSTDPVDVKFVRRVDEVCALRDWGGGGGGGVKVCAIRKTANFVTDKFRLPYNSRLII